MSLHIQDNQLKKCETQVSNMDPCNPPPDARQSSEEYRSYDRLMQCVLMMQKGTKTIEYMGNKEVIHELEAQAISGSPT
jgi:hypothetical protein